MRSFVWPALGVRRALSEAVRIRDGHDMKRTIITGIAICAVALVPMTGVATSAAASPMGMVKSATSPQIQATKPGAVRSLSPYKFGTVKYSKWYARYYMQRQYRWNDAQFKALIKLWERESGWGHRAGNASGAYGIPQSMPGTKMRSAGADWRTNPETQIRWGLSYIKSVYGSPTRAWSKFQRSNWY